MAFDSEKGTLSCEYCGTDLPIEEVEQTLDQEEYEPLGEQARRETGILRCTGALPAGRKC